MTKRGYAAMFALSIEGQNYLLVMSLFAALYFALLCLSSFGLGILLFRSLSTLDKFLAGTTVNFALILIPSIPIGTMSNLLIYYFWGLFCFELIIAVLAAIALTKGRIHPSSFKDLAFSKPEMLIAAAIQPYVFYLTVLHPVLYEWDYSVYYGTYFESIMSTGSLPATNIFHNLTSFETWFPPGAPILYAFTTTIFGEDLIRVVPYLLYLIFLIVAYRLWSALSPKKIGTWLVATVAVSPFIIFNLGNYSLYPDLLVAIFVLGGIIYAYEAAKTHRFEFLTISSLCGAVALLSKETTIFMLPLFPLSYAFGSKKFSTWAIGIAFSFITPIGLAYGQIFTGGNKATGYGLIFASILTLAMVTVVWLVSRNSNDNKGKLHWLLLLPLFSLVGAIWYVRNYFVLKSSFFPLIVGKSYLKAYTFASSFLSSNPDRLIVLAPSYTSVIQSFTSLVRYDFVLDQELLTGTLLLFEILGILILLYKRNAGPTFALFGFGLMIFIWQIGFLFNNNYGELRHLMPFYPFVLAISTIGLDFLFEKFKLSETIKPYCFSAVLIVYSSTFVEAIGWDGVGLKLTPINTDYLTLPTIALAIISVVMVIVPGLLLPNFHFPKRLGQSTLGSKIILVTALVIMIVVESALFPSATLIYGNTSVANVQNFQLQELYPGWNQQYLPVIQYYSSGAVPMSAVTLAWYDVGISYLTHHKVIDLRDDVYGYMSISNLLLSNSTQYILAQLRQDNITYFLIPNDRHATFSEYIALDHDTILFDIVRNPLYSKVVKQFPTLTLYKLLPVQQIPELSSSQDSVPIQGVNNVSSWTLFPGATISNTTSSDSVSFTYNKTARVECCDNLLAYHFNKPLNWSRYLGMYFSWVGGSGSMMQLYIGNSEYSNGEYFIFNGTRSYQTLYFGFNNPSVISETFNLSNVNYLIISTTVRDTSGTASFIDPRLAFISSYYSTNEYRGFLSIYSSSENGTMVFPNLLYPSSISLGYSALSFTNYRAQINLDSLISYGTMFQPGTSVSYSVTTFIVGQNNINLSEYGDFVTKSGSDVQEIYLGSIPPTIGNYTLSYIQLTLASNRVNYTLSINSNPLNTDFGFNGKWYVFFGRTSLSQEVLAEK